MFRLVLLGSLYPLLVLGQGQPLPRGPFTRSLTVTTENDNFLREGCDCYYTNGIAVELSILQKTPKFFSRKGATSSDRKTIIHLKVAHEIYTPEDIEEEDVDQLDRPYAGYLHAQAEVSTFRKRSFNARLAIDAGVVGSRAGGDFVQEKWHRFIRYTPPRGWHYQLRDEVILNASAYYRRAWPLASVGDVLAHGRLRVGTGFNDASSGLTVRLGKINTIDNSILSGSRLSQPNAQAATRRNRRSEWFVWGGTDITATGHNTFIDGSMFSRLKSRHTESSTLYHWRQQFGLAYSSASFGLKLTAHRLGAEVQGGEKHRYLRIDVTVRF